MRQPAPMLTEPIKRRNVLRLGAGVIGLPLLTGAADPSDTLRAVRKQATDVITRGEVPSLTIAVFRHGKPLWIEAFGWADRGRNIRATPHIPYAIASASKPFTATAVAKLIVEGRFGLDTPIERYVGHGLISAQGKTVTLRQLLQHRSGIARHWRNLFKGQVALPPFSQIARKHAFVTPAHGRRYLYSNMNYGLLAHAVEMSGTPLHRHLRETIFAPLRLESASFLQEHLSNWRAAIPYEEDGSAIPAHTPDEAGARDLVMTATDLARFGVAHLKERFDAASRLMIAGRAEIGTNGASRASYGLGWVIEEESPAALFSYGHTGEGPGAASSLTIIPAEQLVVATIANAQGAPAYALNEAIVDALSPRFAERRKANPFQERSADATTLRKLDGRWRGTFGADESAIPVTLTLAAERSTLQIADAAAVPLTHASVIDGVFSVRSDTMLPTGDARQTPHHARLSLEAVGADIEGTIAAYARRGKIPHDQFWLSYPIRLSRT